VLTTSVIIRCFSLCCYFTDESFVTEQNISKEARMGKGIQDGLLAENGRAKSLEESLLYEVQVSFVYISEDLFVQISKDYICILTRFFFNTVMGLVVLQTIKSQIEQSKVVVAGCI